MITEYFSLTISMGMIHEESGYFYYFRKYFMNLRTNARL